MTSSSEATGPDSEQELQAEIEEKRQQLGRTVEQLAAKANVKNQAKAITAKTAGRLSGEAGQLRRRVQRGVAAANQRHLLLAAGILTLAAAMALKWRNKR